MIGAVNLAQRDHAARTALSAYPTARAGVLTSGAHVELGIYLAGSFNEAFNAALRAHLYDIALIMHFAGKGIFENLDGFRQLMDQQAAGDALVLRQIQADIQTRKLTV